MVTIVKHNKETQMVSTKTEQTTPSSTTSYENRLNEFVKKLTSTNKIQFNVEVGRKYDKVFTGKDANRTAVYMVEKSTETIYGTKSWAMINRRRMYGTLSTMDQYDWSGRKGVPLAGTDAAAEFERRETEIVKNYKPRGRPRKTVTPKP